jgi:hypothetical protein
MSVMKAKPALVDAYQGDAELGQQPAYAQHGAVAPDHQRKVAMGANSGRIKGWKLRQTGIAGGVLFYCHITTLGTQEMSDVLQRRPGTLCVVLADQCDMAELRLHR